jgi:outer membrane protein
MSFIEFGFFCKKNSFMRFFILLIVLILPEWACGQKFGYIDSEAIVAKMKEYKDMQTELEKATSVWQAEIDAKGKALAEFKAMYLAEMVLLTPEMKKEREDTISKKANELREFQQNVFGYEGMLYIKNQELLKPILEKVHKAASKVARKFNLAMLIDIASDLVVIYADKKYDFTDYVLEELGLGDPSDTPQK